VARPRPQASTFATSGSDTFGFPSGHAMTFTLFFGLLAYLAWSYLRPGWLRLLAVGGCGAVILLVGVSRVYLSDHWPSDVLGGYLFGLVWLLLTLRAYRRV